MIIRFLLLLVIATSAYGNNLYLSINEILLSKNTVLEHHVYNQINQNFESSSGYINRTSEEIKIVMTEPLNETYSLFDTYIEYCDLDFNECSIITEPQIVNSPFFKIISDGLKEDNAMNDILIFNRDIELTENAIKIYQDVNHIELTYYDSLGILNKIKISKI